MQIIESKPYCYAGCWEGEFIHRFYLDKDLREAVQPRDLLALYRWMRNIGPNEHLDLMKPSAMRGHALGKLIPNLPLFGESCEISYQCENLIKSMSPDIVINSVNACREYILEHAVDLLDVSETETLLKLNEYLMSLEQSVFKQHKQRVQENRHDTYEMNVQYLLAKNDSLYLVQDCNVLFEANILFDSGVTDDRDFNNKRHLEGVIYQEVHCWLFHELEDHSPVPLKHISRIKKIKAEISARTDINLSDFDLSDST